MDTWQYDEAAYDLVLTADAEVAVLEPREARRDAAGVRPLPSRILRPNVIPVKVTRNAPCVCGSGRKFKDCHGRGR